MNAEELLEARNRVEEIAIEIRTLWSTLEAVHDAMCAEFESPELYNNSITPQNRPTAMDKKAAKNSNWTSRPMRKKENQDIILP